MTTPTTDHTSPSAPNAEVFDLLTYARPVYIQPEGAARATAAITGLQTVLALLHQREVDADAGTAADGLTFGPYVAAGLLCAAASCGELLTQILSGDHHTAHAFATGSPGERAMADAIGKAKQADQANSKAGKP